MTDITAALKKIQVEEIKYGAADSEYTMSKIGAAINAIIEEGIEPLGTKYESMLTEAQFQAIKGNKWVRMTGQSIVGSDLHALTSVATLPDYVGNQAFTRQADIEGSIGDYQSNQNAAHTHSISGSNTTGVGDNYYFGDATGLDYSMSTTSSGGAEARPNAYKMNFFIKININNT